MKLILFRHGIAIDREEFIKKKKDDDLRPLTEKGRERTMIMAKALKSWLPEIDMVTSSPLVRAHQTAEIICETYKKSQIHESVELSPASPPMAYAQWLKLYAKTAQTIIAVGHEPQMSVFASWCLSGQTQSFIELKKSGIICLELASFEEIGPRTVNLLWAIPPKLLPKS